MRLILQRDERAQVLRTCGKHLDCKQRDAQYELINILKKQKTSHHAVESTNYISKTNNLVVSLFFLPSSFIWICLYISRHIKACFLMQMLKHS